ncbi:MAG: hypothetical protein GX556_11195 [Fibrobacter sp.]|nr:hypothetical protein [Fibrobacter sp.]
MDQNIQNIRPEWEKEYFPRLIFEFDEFGNATIYSPYVKREDSSGKDNKKQ